MSIQAMTRVMADSQAEGTARLVLLVMANRAGGDEDVCFASVERIARDARVHPRTVQRWIRHLEGAGEIVHLGHHPRFATNLYAVMPVGGGVNLPVPQMGDDSAGPQLPPELKELGSDLGLVEETLAVALPSAPRKHDALFEVVAEVCGIDWQNGMTKMARGALNKAVSEIRPLNPDPEDVRLRASNWPYDVPLTPNSLAKHWPALAKAHVPRPRDNSVSRALAMADAMEVADASR